jgi:hypothetical protein
LLRFLKLFFQILDDQLLRREVSYHIELQTRFDGVRLVGSAIYDLSTILAAKLKLEALLFEMLYQLVLSSEVLVCRTERTNVVTPRTSLLMLLTLFFCEFRDTTPTAEQKFVDRAAEVERDVFEFVALAAAAIFTLQ